MGAGANKTGPVQSHWLSWRHPTEKTGDGDLSSIGTDSKALQVKAVGSIVETATQALSQNKDVVISADLVSERDAYQIYTRESLPSVTVTRHSEIVSDDEEVEFFDALETQSPLTTEVPENFPSTPTGSDTEEIDEREFVDPPEITTVSILFDNLRERLEYLAQAISLLFKKLYPFTKSAPSKPTLGTTFAQGLLERTKGPDVAIRAFIYDSVFKLLEQPQKQSPLKDSLVEAASLSTAVQLAASDSAETSLKQLNGIYARNPDLDETGLLDELRNMNPEPFPIAPLTSEELDLLEQRPALISPHRFTTDAKQAQLTALESGEKSDPERAEKLIKFMLLVKLEELEKKMKQSEFEFIRPLTEVLYKTLIENNPTLNTLMPAQTIKDEITQTIYFFVNQVTDPYKLNTALLNIPKPLFSANEIKREMVGKGYGAIDDDGDRIRFIEARLMANKLKASPEFEMQEKEAIELRAQIKAIIEKDRSTQVDEERKRGSFSSEEIREVMLRPAYMNLGSDDVRVAYIVEQLISSRQALDTAFPQNETIFKELMSQAKDEVFKEKVNLFIKNMPHEVKTEFLGSKLKDQYKYLESQMGPFDKAQQKVMLSVLQLRRTPDVVPLGAEALSFILPVAAPLINGVQGFVPNSLTDRARTGLQQAQEKVLRDIVETPPSLDPVGTLTPIIAPNEGDPKLVRDRARDHLKKEIFEAAGTAFSETIATASASHPRVTAAVNTATQAYTAVTDSLRPIGSVLAPIPNAMRPYLGDRAVDLGIYAASTIVGLPGSVVSAAKNQATGIAGRQIDRAFDRLQHHQINKFVMYYLLQSVIETVVHEIKA